MLTQEKRPEDKRYLPITWEDWIPSTDPIATVTFTTEAAGVTISGESFSGMIAFCFVEGGTAGQFFSIDHTVTCQSGRVESTAIPFYVKDEALSPA